MSHNFYLHGRELKMTYTEPSPTFITPYTIIRVILDLLRRIGTYVDKH